MQQGGGGAGRGFQGGSGGGRGAGGGGRGPGGGGRGAGGPGGGGGFRGGQGGGGGGFRGRPAGGPGGGGFSRGPGGPGGGEGGFRGRPAGGPGGAGGGEGGFRGRPAGGGFRGKPSGGGFGGGEGGGGFSRGPARTGGGFARGPGGPPGEGAPRGPRPGGDFRPGGFKKPGGFSKRPAGGFGGKPGGFGDRPAGGFGGKPGGGFRGKPRGEGAGGFQGPAAWKDSGEAPGRGGALPSKSWGAGGPRGGAKGGFQKGPRKGGFGAKGHAQERFGGHLPPPPRGVGGRPLDVEEEARRAAPFAAQDDAPDAAYEASADDLGALESQDGVGHDDGADAGGDEDAEDDQRGPRAERGPPGGAKKGKPTPASQEGVTGPYEKRAKLGTSFKKRAAGAPGAARPDAAPKKAASKKSASKKAPAPPAADAWAEGADLEADDVEGPDEAELLAEAAEVVEGMGAHALHASDDDEAEGEPEAGAKGAPREKPHFGRAADAEGRTPRLKQQPGDFQVREVVDLPKSVTSPGTEGADLSKLRYFIHRLTKKKLTTPEAITLIARRFDIPKSAFSYGGLKDKQSFSEQLISIEGRAIEHREAGLKVVPVGRRATPITSDDIKANRFEIVVRGLTRADLEGLPARLAEASAFGFPNYFDSQRFGSSKFGQGFLARSLVRGDAEGALRLYMATPSPRDHSSDRFVKQIIAERWGDWEGLARRMRASPYGRILGHLAHAPEDFMGAIGYMSRSLRALHLFAYQSLIWNNAVQFFLREALPKEARFTVPYQCGRLIFWKRLLPETQARFDGLSIPLVGPDTAPTDEFVKAAVLRSLKTEGVGYEAFKLPESTGGFFKDEPRALVVKPGHLEASEPVRDDLNEGRLAVTLSFDLPRGAYGTLLVKRIFRG